MMVYCKSSFKHGKKKKTNTKSRTTFVFTAKKPVESKRYIAPSLSHIPSKIDSFLEENAPAAARSPVRYEGELAAREAAAQQEIARKAKCVAPLYSKGAYQYVATEEQAKWVGRK